MAEPRRDLPLPLKASLTRPDGRATTEYILNLSPGGCCLQVRDPVGVGEAIRLGFELPEDGRPVTLEGRVVWFTCEQERGPHLRFCEMGVRFGEVEGDVRESLLRFASQPSDRRR